MKILPVKKRAGMVLAVLYLSLLCIISGCDSIGGEGDNKDISLPTDERVESILQEMSLEDKVGQVMIGYFEGADFSTDLAGRLNEINLGGIILYSVSGNVESVEQVTRLVEEAQQSVIDSYGIPLFISIDHEGGIVCRITDGVTVFPGNMALGATGSVELAGKSAAVMAKELRLLGINMNLAPVVDVNNNPANPVIGVRSFGSDPEDVARMGTAMVEPYNREGVISTAKHYPGHGDTDLDSHYYLPLIPHHMERLEEVELFPFKAMVDSGVPAIMTAHVLIPALTGDDNLPATLSAEALGYLREDMGFAGLIITDSMGMGAITNNYGLEEASIMAFQAGADILLYGADMGHEPENQVKVYRALVEAVKNDSISEERLNDSVRRILKYKIDYGIMDNPLPGANLSGLADSDSMEIAREVAMMSITLVQDNDNHLPLPVEGGIPVIWPEEREGALDYLLEECPFLVPYLLPVDVNQGIPPEVLELVKEVETVVIGSYNLHRNEKWAEMINSLPGNKVVAVSMGSPYDIIYLPNISTYLAAYGDLPVSVKALGEVLRGDQIPTGVLPVELP